MFGTDFILNGEGHGPVANLLAGVRCDPGLLRPYFDDKNIPCVTVNTGRIELVEVKDKRTGAMMKRRRPIFEEVRVKDLVESGVQLPYVTTNATTLRRDEWIEFDNQLIEPQRERLRAYRDIARMSTYTFNGLGTLMLEHETVSDPGRAYMDFDGLSEGTVDTPLFQPEGQPVPIFHSNFTYDRRRLEASRKSGNPLNVRGVNWATRRVMELVERNVIGVAGTPVEYGSSSHTTAYTRTPGVYGMINFPDRITKTDLTIPTGSNPEATITDILEMRQLLYDANHYGPYGIYHSTDWDQFLDHDYARAGGNNANQTLRQRILAIGGEDEDGSGESKQIKFVRRLDFLTPADSHAFTMVMVSMNPNVVRALNGMPVTVFQYETRGGWSLHFRVACIMLAEFFADFAGNCGVLHARTA